MNANEDELTRINSKHEFCTVAREQHCAVLQFVSMDGTNKLSCACVLSLLQAIEDLKLQAGCGDLQGLVITGNRQFFSAGADVNEIARLTGPAAFQFARLGQKLMHTIDTFPALVIAAVEGYCMGGGLDLALACDCRMAAPSAIFGHRGAALGLMTGWGGTQRLPRLTGKARALEMFILADKIHGAKAYELGLVNMLSEEPVKQALAFFKYL